MGSIIYFQRTKYQKNRCDTFSAMLYFILMFHRQLIQSHGVKCDASLRLWRHLHGTLDVRSLSKIPAKHCRQMRVTPMAREETNGE